MTFQDRTFKGKDAVRILQISAQVSKPRIPAAWCNRGWRPSYAL